MVKTTTGAVTRPFAVWTTAGSARPSLRHRRVLEDAHALRERDAPEAADELARMDRRGARIVDAAEKRSRAGECGDAGGVDLLEHRDARPRQRIENAGPGTHMAGAGRAPDPAVGTILGVDPVRHAEGLDLAPRPREGRAQKHRAFFPAERSQRVDLRPLRKDHAGIPPRGAAAADVGFDDHDIAGGLAPLDVERRPQAGIAAADDADIGADAVLEHRGIDLAGRDRLAQPDAAADGAGGLCHGEIMGAGSRTSEGHAVAALELQHAAGFGGRRHVERELAQDALDLVDLVGIALRRAFPVRDRCCPRGRRGHCRPSSRRW